MSQLYNKLVQSVRWNSFEAILYQAILLSHNVMLFKTAPRTLFGVVGMTFSLVYLTISLTNLGLNQSIAPLFSLYTKNKNTFCSLLLSQIGIQIVLLTLTCVGISLLGAHVPFLARMRSMLQLTTTHACIVFGLILFEATKKTLREILQIAFLSAKTAPLELCSIVTYVSCVWLWYTWHGTLNIYTIFAPMLVTSIGNVVVLSYFVFRYYTSLPNGPFCKLSDVIVRIAKNRSALYLNRLSSTLFSNNCLVPFFALYIGIEQAGLLKFVGTVSFCITYIVRHVFGVSGSALLAHLQHKNSVERYEQFLVITRWLTYCLGGIFVFLLINHQKILGLHAGTYTQQTLYAAYFFLAMTIAENLFLGYETWYTNEEKSHYLLCFNLASMLALYSIMYHAASAPFLLILVALLGTRLASFVALALCSRRLWQIKPTLYVPPRYALSAVLISAIFYFLV